jgi:hypothetical protein
MMFGTIPILSLKFSNSDTPKAELQFEESYRKSSRTLKYTKLHIYLIGVFNWHRIPIRNDFGAISLSKIKKNPEKFKGKGIAKFSFI